MKPILLFTLCAIGIAITSCNKPRSTGQTKAPADTTKIPNRIDSIVGIYYGVKHVSGSGVIPATPDTYTYDTTYIDTIIVTRTSANTFILTGVSFERLVATPYYHIDTAFEYDADTIYTDMPMHTSDKALVTFQPEHDSIYYYRHWSQSSGWGGSSEVEVFRGKR